MRICVFWQNSDCQLVEISHFKSNLQYDEKTVIEENSEEPKQHKKKLCFSRTQAQYSFHSQYNYLKMVEINSKNYCLTTVLICLAELRFKV